MPPKNKQVSITNIRTIIEPFLDASSSTVFEAAAILSPIPGSAYVHNNAELKRKREHNKGIDRISNAMKGTISENHQKKIRHRSAKKLPNQRQLPTISARLPYPKYGNQYNKDEIIAILHPFQNKTRSITRHLTINKIIEQGLVAGGKSTIYAVLKKDHKGTPPIYKDFLKPGRIRIIPEDRITLIGERCKEYDGKTIGISEMRLLIENERRNVITEQGGVPIMHVSPSVQTVKNIPAMVANQCGISIDGSTAIAKTNTRFTAENSIIAAMSLALAIAYANYIPITEEDPSITKEMEDAPIGVKLMYDLVRKHYGCPIYPVKPQYILSTDDTVVYVFEGKGRENEHFRLVSTKSIAKSGTMSKYRLDDNKSMKGMMV